MFGVGCLVTIVVACLVLIFGGVVNAQKRGGAVGFDSWKRDFKKASAKAERMSRTVQMIESIPIPPSFQKDAGVPDHNRKGPAILAAAMSTEMIGRDAKMFALTARNSGYSGDMVLAVLPTSQPKFLEVLKFANAITYTLNPNCTGIGHDKKCSMSSGGLMVSINMIRFYMYQWWARMYDPDALIMISDFRDVFFQGNPFTYKTYEWAPPVAQMVVFQEVFPNKVIYRCPFNSGWIENCYGTEALKRVASNTVSCSGVSIGTRNAILLYAHLVTLQLDPRVRYGRNTTKTNDACVSLGMDQGFHNWLIYSGQLDKYMDIKIYQQGEGPVNTVGAFFGERAILKWNLEEWKVLRGEAPNQYIHNWNGDKSPVIHQADRFLNREFSAGYESKLAVAGIAAKTCCN